MKVQAEKWLVTAAIAVSLPVLVPVLRKTLKPLARQGSNLVKQTCKQIQIVTVKAKQELEDIWLEAKYERMQKNNRRFPHTFVD
ncbi:hypothetical protein [Thermoflavimicrobium dichotomicum]|uniref:Uncharacterized protein n=1 Tax=Thermoflavimicrobium dichotomicum TaxID=46223 RepID=A0A1I3NBD3_9BACL|nr:hypothetical protein [Thermoflavimicrobium dichotomicum]SFJ06066.1 hypothetical protein SAMN05421852_10458 [Thermoflavimicrobium dichotomicum]